MERLICLAIGYVFGMFQTAFIYGKLHHMDIREHGSGNAGTTNALRTMGWGAGFTVFIGDTLKAVLSSIVVRFIFKASHPDSITMLLLYSGIGVVLGHNFPAYLKFKGGKGIAATAGVILSLGCWQLIVACLITFFVTLAISKHVSTSSLTFVTMGFAGFVLFSQLGIIGGLGTKAVLIEAYIVMFVFMAMAFIRHKDNIKRLINGTESVFTLKGHRKEDIHE